MTGYQSGIIVKLQDVIINVAWFGVYFKNIIRVVKSITERALQKKM